MVVGTIVICVALVMSVTLFVLNILMLRISMSIISQYIGSLMTNGENMLASIDEQISVLRAQLDQQDMFMSMENGDMFDHEPGDDDDN